MLLIASFSQYQAEYQERKYRQEMLLHHSALSE
jgi:hypothetical protein